MKTSLYEYDLKKKACPNPYCTLYGNTEESKVISNGTHRTKEGTISLRFYCNEFRHDTVQRWLAVAAVQNGKIDAMLF